jgi:hypothetical protein
LHRSLTARHVSRLRAILDMLNPLVRPKGAASAVLLSAALLSLAVDVSAQSNAVPGLDAALVNCFSLTQRGRSGGVVAVSSGVDICNFGSVNIDWRAPMDPRHPMYSQMVCREFNGRFEQISDWSYVKHGFLSINGSICGSCSENNGSLLGPNCSDTYGSSLNANTFYLGPPAEIDPWLGIWDPVGSHFDQGFPPVSGPAAMDGVRSTINAPNNLFGRVNIQESDLGAAGATYYYGLYVVVTTEPGGANRDNNFVNREFVPTFTNSWSFANASASVTQPMLNNWTGATIETVGNGNDDGQFYVAAKVEGPDAVTGLYHYEYVVHNRDNSRGAASVRLSKSPTATISNLYFGDIDQNVSNDWSISVSSNEIAFLAGGGNAIEWNTMYNFAFDSTEAPTPTTVSIDQARPGPGLNTLQVVVDAPVTPPNPISANVTLSGQGCPLPAAFYESFAGVPDLNGMSFELSPSGGGFLVDACTSNCFEPNFGTNLNLTDESFSGTLNLGFTIDLPGVSTSSIRVSSNGWISLQPGAFTNSDFSQTTSELLSQGPRLAPLWEDYDPGVAGDVYFRAEPGRAIVTFDNVAEWSRSGTSNSFQVQFLQDGTVRLWYGANNTANNAVVGYSQGNVSIDPGATDLSAVPYSTGAGGVPLRLDSTLPVLGGSTTLTMSNLPAGTVNATLYAGVGEQMIDLSFLQAIGCFFSTTADFATLMNISGSNATFAFPVPNDPVLSGALIYTQGLGIAPGLSPLNFATTNTAELLFGY